MVQVLPGRQKTPTFLESLGAGLGQGLAKLPEQIQERQKQKQFSQALQDIQDVYSNSDLNEQQKLIFAHQKLAGHPELAKQIGSQLSGMGETPLQAAQRRKLQFDLEQAQGDESFFNKIMRGEDQEDEREADFQQANDIGAEGEFEPERGTTSKRAPAKFDPNDPSTWTKKQIDNFRSYQGDNRKGKTFAKMAQNEFERRGEETKKKQTYQEKTAPFESALSTITRMRELGKTGQLGVGSSLNPLPSRRRASAEYEQLGKSLIALASTIPIRNQREFETLSHNLFDSTLSDAKREGILNAMEKIIRSSMEAVPSPDEETTESRAPSTVRAQQGGTAPKEKRALQSFYK